MYKKHTKTCINQREKNNKSRHETNITKLKTKPQETTTKAQNRRGETTSEIKTTKERLGNDEKTIDQSRGYVKPADPSVAKLHVFLGSPERRDGYLKYKGLPVARHVDIESSTAGGQGGGTTHCHHRWSGQKQTQEPRHFTINRK
ncbi:hypothetical protein V6N12_023628 [Hibiscus sabdariffa]|uniref:Uncharacterized protein n=1 Tax=Hibiscus sabdariffa TaxID=183260 RepID=A0ABR2FY81_9ROSI